MCLCVDRSASQRLDGSRFGPAEWSWRFCRGCSCWCCYLCTDLLAVPQAENPPSLAGAFGRWNHWSCDDAADGRPVFGRRIKLVVVRSSGGSQCCRSRGRTCVAASANRGPGNALRRPQAPVSVKLAGKALASCWRTRSDVVRVAAGLRLNHHRTTLGANCLRPAALRTTSAYARANPADRPRPRQRGRPAAIAQRAHPVLR